MIRAVRRQLARIRYHSANPQLSRWDKLKDAALFISFGLAFVAALLTDLLVQRTSTVETFSGRLYRTDDGVVAATLVDPDFTGGWTVSQPVGRFDLDRQQHQYGWPFSSLTAQQPLAIELLLFRGGQQRRGNLHEMHGVDEEIVAAIIASLESNGVATTELGSTDRTRHWPRWFMNAGIWWILLYTVAIVALIPTRIVMALLRHRTVRHKHQRHRKGHCQHCGYNLRGLEFRDRCPECGELINDVVS